ncbi:hypothetical protein RclHR1_00080012 [Rhizophagus clarus]|uniref:Uncharacterized protein n=1 Tax=Rhizophagus clarus TaxID=94130 RepID=A0A2Z6SAN9_9GLOM|nr:hypothetical protein RclHR1_00080012 [Rhizophagus clarus]GET04064.1 hypothetical protein GLOIN_2v1475065 [Rhizophagus clarus]
MSYNNNDLNIPQPPHASCNCSSCVAISYDIGKHQLIGNFQISKPLTYVTYVVHIFCPVISDRNDVISANCVPIPTSYARNPNPRYIDHTQDIRNSPFLQRNHFMTASGISSMVNNLMTSHDMSGAYNAPASQIHNTVPSFDVQQYTDHIQRGDYSDHTQYTGQFDHMQHVDVQYADQSNHVNQQDFQNQSYYTGPYMQDSY